VFRARACVCVNWIYMHVCAFTSVRANVCARVRAHTTRLRISVPASVPACRCVGGWVSMHVNAISEGVCICVCVCLCFVSISTLLMVNEQVLFIFARTHD